MNLRLISLAVATALAFAPAGKAADGNIATGSVGTVQASSVSSEPVVEINTPVAQVTVQAPVSLPGAGGNEATDSIGTAQAGGGHTAARSIGTAQAGSTEVGPVATNDGTQAVAAPTPTIGAPGARPDAGATTLSVHATPTALQQSAAVDGELTLVLRSLWLQAKRLGVSPAFSLTLEPLARVLLGGTIATGPTAGDQSDSLLTGQAGSITVAPTAAIDSAALGSSLALDGASGVQGTGANLANGSLASVQAGGPNTADRSFGTVQVGGVALAPALRASTPAGDAVLGGSSGIQEGSSRATDSVGTVQIGGGSSADGSTGTVQAGAVGLGPALTLTGTPVGDTSLGGSTGIAGGGNTAGDSIGTVQVGGGNGAQGSTGAVQVGGGRKLASAGGGTPPAGGATQTAGEAIPSTAPGSPASAGAQFAGRRASSPRAVARVPRTAAGRATPAAGTPGLGTRVSGTLPFTGLNLALLLAVGLALVAAGLGVRGHARR